MIRWLLPLVAISLAGVAHAQNTFPEEKLPQGLLSREFEVAREQEAAARAEDARRSDDRARTAAEQKRADQKHVDEDKRLQGSEPPLTEGAQPQSSTSAPLTQAPEHISFEERLRRAKKALLPEDLFFGFHGYFRAPLRLTFASRNGSEKVGESSFDVRVPHLVDDNYGQSGFAYTRLQETDFTEMYLSAGNRHFQGTIAMQGSLYSDSAYLQTGTQLGIAQGYVTFRWGAEGERLKFDLQVKGGAFWDRFGWLPRYDTYMFGRTHQMGVQSRLDFSTHGLRFWLVQGFGAHLADPSQTQQGLTLLNYVNIGIATKRYFQFGAYFLDAASRDKKPFIGDQSDGDMRVYGVDGRLTSHMLGNLYLAFSAIDATQVKYLSPALEVVHSLDGAGLMNNFLGSAKSNNGSGRLWNLALDYQLSLRKLLDATHEGRGAFFGKKGGDVTLAVFGMLTYVESAQKDPDRSVNRDGRLYYKYGFESAWVPLSWLSVALRYDRVILDAGDEQNTFRILTPRVSLRTHFLADAEIFVAYSRYWYGSRVAFPVPIRGVDHPDDNVLKFQAQFVF